MYEWFIAWGCRVLICHQFLGHDGITSFTELVDMQQNVYGVGYDLAVFLATLGVAIDGDPGKDGTPLDRMRPCVLKTQISSWMM